ncbi:MAG TPA: rhodanese-like domain-containing protein [Aridibacter sp.]|nr:rhodanese-like domain-containing protein [Aridibacter sp.]
MQEITATELKEKMDAGEDIVLIDVRNQDEFAFARIEGAKLIPFGEVMARADEFDSDKETVVMCRSGVRSARVIEFLESRGREGSFFNLVGGILAWSNEVDPTVPKY